MIGTTPSHAYGQPGNDQPSNTTPNNDSANQQAVALGHEGLTLFKAGDYTQAYERFAAAEKLFPSPVFVLYMARCRRNDSRLLQAEKLYQQVAQMKLPDSAPQPWGRAQRDAQHELSELSAITPRLTLKVPDDDGRTPYTIHLDGRALTAAQLRAPVALDPGKHQLELRTQNGTVRRTVQLQSGQKRTVELRLPGRRRAPRTMPAPRPRPPSTTRTRVPNPDPTRNQSRTTRTTLHTGQRPEQPLEDDELLTLGWVTVAAGGACLLLGAITGAIALDIANDINDQCVGDRCRPEDADDADRARELATLSTVSFIVGAAATAVGTTLVLIPTLRDDDGAPSPSAALRLTPTSASLRIDF